MKTQTGGIDMSNKTGLVAFINWFGREFLIGLDDGNTNRRILLKAQALLAAEKSAMEQAQGQQDGLREFLKWLKEGPCASEITIRNSILKGEEILSRHPQSVEAQKPTASPEKSTQGQGYKGLTDYIEELEKSNSLRIDSNTGIIRKHYAKIIYRLKQIAEGE